MNLDSFADDIGTAKASDFGNRFKKGVYLLWLDSMKPKISDKTKDRLIIPEFHVLESTSVDLAPGATVSEVFNLDGKAKQVHPGKVRQLIAAACGSDDYEKVGPDDVKKAISEDQRLHGRLIRAEATESDKKDDEGNPYIRVRYTPATKEQQEQAREFHIKAGFAPI